METQKETYYIERVVCSPEGDSGFTARLKVELAWRDGDELEKFYLASKKGSKPVPMFRVKTRLHYRYTPDEDWHYQGAWHGSVFARKGVLGDPIPPYITTMFGLLSFWNERFKERGVKRIWS